MNERDMRVIKTKESIEKAFFDLLGTKPLDKVTVVELAKAARIHKSTFYLHYLDIPDLYTKTMQKTLIGPIAAADFFPCLFDDPEPFSQRKRLKRINTAPPVGAKKRRITANEGFWHVFHQQRGLDREGSTQGGTA